MIFKNHYSGSKGNLYSISLGEGVLIIDPGVPIKKIRNRLCGLRHVIGCLVSHSHGDHSAAVKDLALEGIPIYCTSETASAIGIKDYERLQTMHPKHIGQFKIEPFETLHDCDGSVGFIISDFRDKMLFLIDSGSYPTCSISGLTIIAIECNFSYKTLNDSRDRARVNHLALEDVVDFLQAQDISTVKEIHLIHLSERNADRALFIDTIQKITGIATYAIGG